MENKLEVYVADNMKVIFIRDIIVIF